MHIDSKFTINKVSIYGAGNIDGALLSDIHI